MRLRIAWILTLAVIMWVPLPGSDPGVFHQLDLVLHLGLFTVLGGLLWHRSGGNSGRVRVLIGGLLLAVLIEAGQFFAPSRNFNVLDLLMNGCGVLLGYGLRTRDSKQPRLPLYLVFALTLIGTAGILKTFDRTLFTLWLPPRPVLGSLVQAGLVGLAGLSHVFVYGREENWLTLLFPLVPYGLLVPGISPFYLLVGSGLLIGYWALDALPGHRELRSPLLIGGLAPLFLVWLVMGLLKPETMLLEGGKWVSALYLLWGGVLLVRNSEPTGWFEPAA